VNITPRIRRSVIIGTCAVCLCGSLHRLILAELTSDMGILLCDYDPGEDNLAGAIIWQIDTVLYNYLPCVLIFVANILTLLGIFRSRLHIEGKQSSRVSKGDSKVILSLMIVSTLYVVFLTPPSALWTYWDGPLRSETHDQQYIQFIFYVTYMLNQISVINYCCNFIVYGCTMPFYRQEASQMFLSLCKPMLMRPNGDTRLSSRAISRVTDRVS
jgi:hypothetical protein